MNIEKYPFQLTNHARKVIEERNIKLEWIERVISAPRETLTFKDDSELEHAIKEIGEYENRVLRVIYNKNTDPLRIITVYFDRTLRGKS